MFIRRKQGFTIVELLIVIVVIGILASITIVAFNGIQNRARNAETQSAMNGLAKKIEIYNAQQGSYPSTGGLGVVRSDDNCTAGTSQADWIPNLSDLPQSKQSYKGVGSYTGCYLYASDGTSYVLSAWNMVYDGPQKSTMYRRLGFREIGFMNSNFYICNHGGSIGGNLAAGYSANSDYYKHSYTMSNITTCNETPPAGA